MSIGLRFSAGDYINHYDNNSVSIHPTPVSYVADFKEKYGQFDYINFFKTYLGFIFMSVWHCYDNVILLIVNSVSNNYI